MNTHRLPGYFLRAALALAFLYPPIDALHEPSSWIGYFPSFVLAMAGANSLLLLHAFGVVEVILAVWVISGWKVRFPAIVMALMLIAIVAFNAVQFPILFRDVSIALAALALAFMPQHRAHAPANALA